MSVMHDTSVMRKQMYQYHLSYEFETFVERVNETYEEVLTTRTAGWMPRHEGCGCFRLSGV